jgi:hypothetical protein
MPGPAPKPNTGAHKDNGPDWGAIGSTVAGAGLLAAGVLGTPFTGGLSDVLDAPGAALLAGGTAAELGGAEAAVGAAANGSRTGEFLSGAADKIGKFGDKVFRGGKTVGAAKTAKTTSEMPGWTSGLKSPEAPSVIKASNKADVEAAKASNRAAAGVLGQAPAYKDLTTPQKVKRVVTGTGKAALSLGGHAVGGLIGDAAGSVGSSANNNAQYNPDISRSANFEFGSSNH